MALRRLVTMRMETAAALDVERWRLRMRLHPRDNGCEKNLLFTPQMYEPPEREELAREIGGVAGRSLRVHRYGATSGRLAGRRGHRVHRRILAIEPEPGNFARPPSTSRPIRGCRSRRWRSRSARRRAPPSSCSIRVIAAAPHGGGGGNRAGGSKCDAGRSPLSSRTPGHRHRRAQDRRRRRRGQGAGAVSPDVPVALWPGLIVIEDSSAEWSSDLVRAAGVRGLRGVVAHPAERDAAAAGPAVGGWVTACETHHRYSASAMGFASAQPDPTIDDPRWINPTNGTAPARTISSSDSGAAVGERLDACRPRAIEGFAVAAVDVAGEREAVGGADLDVGTASPRGGRRPPWRSARRDGGRRVRRTESGNSARLRSRMRWTS